LYNNIEIKITIEGNGNPIKGNYGSVAPMQQAGRVLKPMHWEWKWWQQAWQEQCIGGVVIIHILYIHSTLVINLMMQDAMYRF
jgi:hypothetical protein